MKREVKSWRNEGFDFAQPMLEDVGEANQNGQVDPAKLQTIDKLLNWEG